MLTRAIPLVLVMVACSTNRPTTETAAPESVSPQCPLTGTWERRIPLDPRERTQIQGSTEASEMLVRTETFHADGRWTTSIEGSLRCAGTPGSPSVRSDGVATWHIVQPSEVCGRWEMVAGPPRIQVQMTCPFRELRGSARELARGVNGRKWTLAVASPNVLATTYQGRECRLVRISERN